MSYKMNVLFDFIQIKRFIFVKIFFFSLTFLFFIWVHTSWFIILISLNLKQTFCLNINN